MTPDFHPWQLNAFARFLPLLRYSHGAYIGHDVGMGKTLSALTMSMLLECEHVVVFTTSAGVGVWRAEIEKWFPAHVDRLRIHSYEQLTASTPAQRDRVSTTTGQKLTNDLRKWVGWANPGMLICDEGHRTKSPSSKQSRAVRRIAAKTTYKLWLSGTPTHSPLDWWAQMQCIAPHEPLFAGPFSEYRAKIAVMSGPEQNWIKQFRDGTNGTDDVLAQVRTVVDKYVDWAPNTLLNLPEPVWAPVPFDLGDKEGSAYYKMKQVLYFEHEEHEVDASIVFTQYMRLQQITGGFATGTKGEEVAIGKSKLDVLRDLLEQWADHKVVISCRFTAELKAIREVAIKVMKTVDGGVAVIDGNTTDKAGIARAFHAIKTPAVLVIQQKAGGTAIDLTAADALILYSLELSKIAFEQVVGRCQRPGQTSHLQIKALVATGTCDETIYEGLRAAKDENDFIKHLQAAAAA